MCTASFQHVNLNTALEVHRESRSAPGLLPRPLVEVTSRTGRVHALSLAAYPSGLRAAEAARWGASAALASRLQEGASVLLPDYGDAGARAVERKAFAEFSGAATGPDSAAIECLSESQRRTQRTTIEIGVSISMGSGQFSRTAVVDVGPRVVIANFCGYTVQVMRKPLKDSISSAAVLGCSVEPAPLGAKHGVDVDAVMRSGCPVLGPLGDVCEEKWWTPLHVPPGASRGELRLRLHPNVPPANGQSSDIGGAWAWSSSFKLEDGNNIVKLRRMLSGAHVEPVAAAGAHISPVPTSDFDLTDRANPAEVTVLSVQTQTVNARTFVSLRPHASLLPREARFSMYRIDNVSSFAQVRVRQVGVGPAASECVPCYAGCDVEPYDFALDHTSGARKVLLHVRPVGVAALLQLAGGLVGRLLRSSRDAAAAECVVACALSGPEGGVAYSAATANSLVPSLGAAIHNVRHASPGPLQSPQAQGADASVLEALISACPNMGTRWHLKQVRWS